MCLANWQSICFASQRDASCVCLSLALLLEIWANDTVIAHKLASDSRLKRPPFGAVDVLSLGSSHLKQNGGMSRSLIWWRAITWEGAVAFEVTAYLPHPAGLQISPWTRPKTCENSLLSLRAAPQDIWPDRIWRAGVEQGGARQDPDTDHPVCFAWHNISETIRWRVFESSDEELLGVGA